jgi:hypothetical protein
MKKWTLLTLFCIVISSIANAQQKTLTEVISLEMPDDNGARASSIAWHPDLKRYYAPKSGNAEHLMAIFDAKGKPVFPENTKTLFDIRGFWYSPKLKTFCANGYNDNGWVSYILDKNGVPIGIKHLVETMNQPGEQSVGSFDMVNNLVFFLKGQNVVIYNAANQKKTGTIRLHINYKNEKEESDDINDADDEDKTPDNINSTVVVFTGIPKAEFALLDFTNKEIQLYDKNTGYISQKLSLPADAPADEMLCFSYCNNLYWLFDINTKTWKGYKQVK